MTSPHLQSLEPATQRPQRTRPHEASEAPLPLAAVAACALTTLIVNADNTAYPVIVKVIERDLQSGPASIQWLVSVYPLALAVLAFIGGLIADRFDKRRVIVTALMAYAVSLVALSIAPSVGWAIAARALSAVSAVSLVPAGLSALRGLASNNVELGRATALWGGAVGLGMALGPLWGGVASTWSWRLLPLSLAVASVAAALATQVTIPSSPGKLGTTGDLTGSCLLGLASVSLITAIILGGEKRWPLAALALSIAIAVILTVMYRRQRTGKFPIPDAAWRSSALRIALGTAVFNYMAVGSTLLLVAAGIQNAGFSAALAGLALVPLAVGYVWGSRRSHKVAQQRGEGSAITQAGLLGLAASLVGIAVVSVNAGATVALLTLLGVVSGVAMGQVNALSNSAGLREVPKEVAGMAGAFLSASRQLGQAVGVAAGGAVSLAASAMLPGSGWLVPIGGFLAMIWLGRKLEPSLPRTAR